MPQTYEQRKARKLRLIAEDIAGTTSPDFTPAVPAAPPAAGSVGAPVVAPATHLTPAKPMRTASMVPPAAVVTPVVTHDDDDPDFAPAAPAAPTAAPTVAPKGKPKASCPAPPVLHPLVTVAVPQPMCDAAWAAWLASDQGRDCTDPRQPTDALRRSVDLEARLHIAFMAGVAVLTAGG